MYKLFFSVFLVAFFNLSHAAGGYCYNSKTTARQAGPGCLETAWAIADQKWKSEYPSYVSCTNFNTSVAPMSGGTGYSRVRKNTTLGGCSGGGYYGHETTCLDGYSPNASLTQCVANATCTEGTTYDPATGQCSLIDPEPNACQAEAGSEFTMEQVEIEGSSCLNGCQVDYLPAKFDFAGVKYLVGKFTGTTCQAENSGELPPMLPLDDPDAPRNCIVDANGNSLCYNYTDAQLKCGYFNEVRVCEDMFPPSGCGYVNGKYGCVTQTAPETGQLPTTKEGIERMPEWIIEGDEYKTWIWETNNWTEGFNPSGTSDAGEQLKLDGIAKEATLQGLVSELRNFTQATGPALLQPGTEIEYWPTDLPPDTNEQQLEQSMVWGPLEDLVASVTGIDPSTTVPGLQDGSCSSYTFGIGNRTISFPGVEGCERLGWLKLGLAWVFAVFTLMKIYEIAFGVNKS